VFLLEVRELGLDIFYTCPGILRASLCTVVLLNSYIFFFCDQRFEKMSKSTESAECAAFECKLL